MALHWRLPGGIVRPALWIGLGLCAGCFAPPDLPAFDGVPVVPSGQCAPNRVEWVACVLDGDTFDLTTCSTDTSERVRLLGIDAPEIAHDGNPAQCWADEASTELRRLVAKRRVLLTFDHDCIGVYGRTLAYVWLEDEPTDAGPGPDALLINEWMLSEGYARLFDEDFGHPLRMEDRLRAAQSDAQARGLGLWSACDGGAT